MVVFGRLRPRASPILDGNSSHAAKVSQGSHCRVSRCGSNFST